MGERRDELDSGAGGRRTPAGTEGRRQTVPVSNGSIVAFKLVDEGGKLSLEPAWASRDLTSPAAPLIFNGVVFALSTGEHRPGERQHVRRRSREEPPCLRCFTRSIRRLAKSCGRAARPSPRSPAAVSAAAGQVYLVTFDNTLYAFGIPMEH